MCWLALVAEMLLLEAALVKSKLGGYAGKKADWIGLGSRVLIGVLGFRVSGCMGAGIVG